MNKFFIFYIAKRYNLNHFNVFSYIEKLNNMNKLTKTICNQKIRKKYIK